VVSFGRWLWLYIGAIDKPGQTTFISMLTDVNGGESSELIFVCRKSTLVQVLAGVVMQNRLHILPNRMKVTKTKAKHYLMILK